MGRAWSGVWLGVVGIGVAGIAVGGCWEPTPVAPSPDGGVDGADASAGSDASVGLCDAQDARGEGACRALLGVVWDGTQCVTIGGCECVGADCLDRFDSMEACEGAYGQCLTEPPPPPEPCDAQDARGEGLCRAFFGFAWDGRECTGLSGCECVGADCRATYESIDACESAYASCTAPPPCDAQDARGEGLCRAFFGFAWDGRECTGLSGCECVGADCGSLYATEEECRRDRADCAGRVICDPAEVWCRALPPSCRVGQVPSVAGRCWGECVDIDRCAPIPCASDRPCPEGMRCSEGLCQ